jgi:membrane protease YdiL (CAAX protease family)
MLLTAPAGIVFTRIFEARPNLWAVGIAHGLLGALAYYIVMGVDPGAQMLSILQASIR